MSPSAICINLVAAAILGAFLSGPARAADSAVGFVKVSAGAAAAMRGGQRIPLAVGAPIEESDQLETGGDGTLGVTFRDDTRVSLGPNTRLDVSRFTFAPAEQKYGFAIRLLVGTLEYISGLTGKLSPESVSISTPNFNVAVRGTRLLIRAEP